MSGSDVTLEILQDIRDDIRGVRAELRNEIRAVRAELRQELGCVRAELRIHTESFGVVESALRDLAQQQRFVVRYTRALTERDS